MEYDIAEIHEQVYAYLIKDTSLRFTLRQRDRAGRLQRGYWFSGDDRYLVFSFWQGVDWLNKTPNIYFAISQNGASTLEFVTHDDDQKVAFFSDVAEPLGMTRRRGLRSGNSEKVYDQWQKFYKGTDYMAALETFMRQDKKIIDAFIRSTGMSEIFAPIEENEFKNAQMRIEDIRKKKIKSQSFQQEYSDVRAIVLQELLLSNLSLFAEEQRVLFHPNLTCLIGLNGTGKTQILRACVLAFSGFEQNESRDTEATGLLIPKITRMLRISGVNGGQPIYPSEGGYMEIKYRIETARNPNDDTIYHNKVLLLPDLHEVRIQDDGESDFRNVVDYNYKCLFLAFPQLLGEAKSDENQQTGSTFPNLGDAISMLNNQPDNRFEAFADWLRDLYNTANDRQAKGDKNPAERKLIEIIFQIVSAVTDEDVRFHNIDVDKKPHPVWITIGSAPPILFDLVSQGYNNVFGWVGYFLKRLSDVTPAGKDFTQTPGIVLIDEVDTYLHPKWQIKIMAELVDRFPNVQFIVTTHSPYIVGSIPKDKIRIYICEPEGTTVRIGEFTEFTAYGANIDRLSDKIFGVNGRFVPKIRSRFAKLADLIHQGRLSDAKNFLDTEFTDIDTDDPELNRHRMLIKTKTILAQ